jgi:hypothetical protein
VEQAPGEDARRIEDEQIAGDEKEQGGHDRDVEPDTGAPGAGAFSAQSFFSGVDVTLAPQEQTMLRVAHSIFSKRPQAEQRR